MEFEIYYTRELPMLPHCAFGFRIYVVYLALSVSRECWNSYVDDPHKTEDTLFGIKIAGCLVSIFSFFFLFLCSNYNLIRNICVKGGPNIMVQTCLALVDLCCTMLVLWIIRYLGLRNVPFIIANLHFEGCYYLTQNDANPQ